MDLLSRDDLRALIEERADPCVSVFLPTHRAGPAELQQNRIRLKNLLREAEDRLVEGGRRASAAREIVGSGRALLEDGAFWRHQADGLALFLTPAGSRHYRLALRFPELVVVGPRFHVKPLLPLFAEDGRFYVLALSQKDVRLLQGTRQSVTEVDLTGVPRSLAEALRYDQFEKQLQLHTASGPGRGGRGAVVFHGQGMDMEDTKANILRYFQQIDAGLRDFLREERAPLVLAGVEYLFPLYREASAYPHLLETGIAGNPELLRAEELHARAWDVVKPHFQKAQAQAAARYQELAGTGRASDRLEEVVPAAHQGRVDSLFVAVGAERWGTIGPDGRVAESRTSPAPGDEDLLNVAAAETVRNRGTVYAVEPSQVPGGAELAAIFRY